jgi:thiamine biosynthesis lipoprotein
MGTIASLSCETKVDEPFDVQLVRATLDRYDERYSLFTPSSEISRIRSGELSLPAASAEMRDTYAIALSWREATNGDFTPHRPDGVVDLAGVVKAISMRDAGDELTRRSIANWCLNVGGDVLVSGCDVDGNAWSVGLVDPDDRIALLTTATLRGTRRACATSGSAERGDHIWTVGAEPSAFVQATVIADDIITADVLATAIIAGGVQSLDRTCESWDVDVMTVDHHGEIRMTPGFTARVRIEN